jgi:hypothetical protein
MDGGQNNYSYNKSRPLPQLLEESSNVNLVEFVDLFPRPRCSLHYAPIESGIVFTEPLPSNELFRLSGFMSQYHNILKVFLLT